jgi:aldehyde dehydrogenase (NAD+)
MERFQNYINGEFVDPESGEWIESVDPWENEAWAEIPRSTKADVDHSVAAASEAFHDDEWSDLTATERGKYLFALADALEDRAERHAEMDVRDNGKPIREMSGQHEAVPDWVRYYAGSADKIQGDTIPLTKEDKLVYTRKEPVGVVAAITAYNSPMLMAIWKVSPALAAGNTVVLKPPETASTSSLALAEAIDAAGIPDGVVNIVAGYGGEAGQPLIEHDAIDKVSFTGGTDNGAHIAETAGSNLTRTLLELGGKNANIVFPDADLDDAVTGALSGIFSASGQSCSAGSRLLLHESIHDEFIDELVERARDITLGDPKDPETDIGPLGSKGQFEKVSEYVDIGAEEGNLVCGGVPDAGEFESDCVVRPTIVTGLDNSARLAREEVFGPVLAVIEFGSEEEAVEIANDTEFGLTAGVWTEDMRRAHRVAHEMRTGRVWINNYRNSSYTSPQGGIKSSGWGRENGQEGLEEYLETKAIWVDLSEESDNAFELV